MSSDSYSYSYSYLSIHIISPEKKFIYNIIIKNKKQIEQNMEKYNLMFLFALAVIIVLLVLIILHFTNSINITNSFQENQNANEQQYGPVPGQIPHIIWSYWDGKDIGKFNKICVNSWKRHAPNWEIRLLNSTSVYDWLDEKDLPKKFKSLQSLQKKADAARLALVARYGGVWMDPSTLLLENFDWIDNLANAGSTSFIGYKLSRYEASSKDIGIENWFFAASQDSYIIKTWHKKFNQILDESPNEGKIQEHKLYKETKLSKRLAVDKNYFLCHTVIQWLQQHDSHFRNILNSPMSHIQNAADGPFWLFKNGFEPPKKIVSVKKEEYIKYTSHHPIRFVKFVGKIRKQIEKDVLNNKLPRDSALKYIFDSTT